MIIPDSHIEKIESRLDWISNVNAGISLIGILELDLDLISIRSVRLKTLSYYRQASLNENHLCDLFHWFLASFNISEWFFSSPITVEEPFAFLSFVWLCAILTNGRSIGIWDRRIHTSRWSLSKCRGPTDQHVIESMHSRPNTNNSQCFKMREKFGNSLKLQIDN